MGTITEQLQEEADRGGHALLPTTYFTPISPEQLVCPEGMVSLLIVDWLGLLLCLQAPVITQVCIYQWIL